MDLIELMKAVDFAAEKHKEQKRKDPQGTPYINHPIRVCNKLTKAGITDLKILQAALLHDTLEDTKTTAEEIEKEFGIEVLKIVQECSDDKKLPAAERKKQQIAHASKISYEAMLVKLADKFDNLTDLLNNQPSSWSIERIQGYYYWSYLVIKEMSGTNTYLENELNELFSGTFIYKEQYYPTLVPENERELLIENYYSHLF